MIKCVPITYTYRSSLPVKECIDNIIDPPWSFIHYQKFYPPQLRWYYFDVFSDTSAQVTFIGGAFRKPIRTKFSLDFSADGDGSVITMRFKGEFLWFPVPFTSEWEIDDFMKQKASATRYNNKQIGGKCNE